MGRPLKSLLKHQTLDPPLLTHCFLRIYHKEKLHTNNQISYCIHRVRWILWFTLGYAAAAAAAVCRDFTVTPLEATIFQLSFLNLVGMFMVTRSCLGLLLGSFRKTRWPPEPFLCRKMPHFRQLVLNCKSNLS